MNNFFLIAALLWAPFGGSRLLPVQVQNQNGVITGRLLKDGKPAAGIRVTAMAIPEAGVRPSDMAAFAGLVQTDSEGRYRLENIPPGRYFITAGFLDVPTYYPGVTSGAEARGIAVGSGATVTDIDFTPAGPPGVTVRGRAIYPPGQAVPTNRQAQLGTGPRGITPALLNADGSFEFSKVRPGTYPLRLPFGSFTVVVGDADVSGIEVKSPLSVTGKLAVEGGGPVPRLALSFTADDGGIATRAFQPDGTFTAQVVEGNYRVSVTGISSAYAVKSITAGLVDLMANPLRLSTASATEPLTVTLKVVAPLFKITGRVRGPGFAQARGPYQLALESDSLVAPLNLALDGGLTGDGSFEVPQLLPPGDYKLRVTAPVLPIPPLSLRVIDKDVVVEVTVPRTKEVPGRVMVEGQPGQGPQPGRMIANEVLLNGQPVTSKSGPALTFKLTDATGNVQSMAAEPEDDGTFRVVLPEGEFRLALEVSGYPVKSFTYGPADLLTNPAFKVETAPDTARFEVMLGQTTNRSGGFRIIATQATTPVNAPPLGTPGVAPGALTTTVHLGPDLAKANLLTPQNLPGGSQEVTLRVSIDKDGRVTNATVMSGNPQLTNAAIEAVQQWRYRPHLVNGQPTPVESTVNVKFP